MEDTLRNPLLKNKSQAIDLTHPDISNQHFFDLILIWIKVTCIYLFDWILIVLK